MLALPRERESRSLRVARWLTLVRARARRRQVKCPAGCGAGPQQVRGSTYYTDDSKICQAAIHAGAILEHLGGLVTITLERGILARNESHRRGSGSHGINSTDAPFNPERLVSMSLYPEATVEVQTVAGHPAAMLSQACGFDDGRPPQKARA